MQWHYFNIHVKYIHCLHSADYQLIRVTVIILHLRYTYKSTNQIDPTYYPLSVSYCVLRLPPFFFSWTLQILTLMCRPFFHEISSSAFQKDSWLLFLQLLRPMTLVAVSQQGPIWKTSRMLSNIYHRTHRSRIVLRVRIGGTDILRWKITLKKINYVKLKTKKKTKLKINIVCHA